MSIAVTRVIQLSVVETLEGEFIDPADATITINQLNTSESLSSSTTPPATKVSTGQIALSGGAITLDLTSLPDSNGVAGAIDGTGLKVQSYIFRNPEANANDITLTEGAANGYELHGNTWKIALRPGEIISCQLQDGAPDIAAGAKDIDITGTGSQALDFEIVMG